MSDDNSFVPELMAVQHALAVANSLCRVLSRPWADSGMLRDEASGAFGKPQKLRKNTQ
jgi:hypothetical protein